MNYKKIKTVIFRIVVSTITSVMFTACGSEDASFNGSETTISLDNITCVIGTPTITDINDYETLLEGDTIVEDDPSTVVSIYHDEDGIKKVCLVSGSAHIVR